MPTLAAAEERWRLTLDHAPVGIALVGLDGRFLRVNGELCRILGRSAEELDATTFQDITHPDDLDDDLEQVEQLLSGEIPHYRMRKRYLGPDGEPIWTELSVALARSASGKPMHFVSHVRDLRDEVASAAAIEAMNRDLTAQSARLEQSNADLEAFALLAGHDLQAPLTALRGYLELLSSEYADVLDDRATDWLQRSERAVERMSELLGSLLDFSRSTAVDGPDAREEVSVPELVEQVSNDLAPLVAETGAVIELVPDSPTVVAHRSQLRQVLQNLVQNTLKYRHPDRPPRVQVSVDPHEGGWLVTVADNARGVPDEHKTTIFAMFTRGDDVDEDSPGHGIGLAASRRIVERHGGSIWVEDNPGGGSRFRFTLRR
jgi:PAS domain S-box-containing protein